jgi:hypothetical protein
MWVFNSSCSAVRAHNRTETYPLFLWVSRRAMIETVRCGKGCWPRAFSTCNNIRWGPRKVLFFTALTVEPIIAGYHKTSASEGRGFCELSIYIPCSQCFVLHVRRRSPVPLSACAQPITNCYCVREPTASVLGDRPIYPPVAVCQTPGGSCDSIVDGAGSKNGIPGELLAIRLAHDSRQLRLGASWRQLVALIARQALVQPGPGAAR